MSTFLKPFPGFELTALAAVPSAAFEVLGYLGLVGIGTLCFLFGCLTPNGAGVLTVLLLSSLIVLSWKHFDQGRHPCFLFLCTLMFFQSAGLLAYCLGAGNDPLRVEIMTPNPFFIPRDGAGLVLFLLALTAICVYAPCRWNYRPIPPPSNVKVKRYLPYLYLVYFCSIPFQAFKNYCYFNYAQQHGGYLAVYLNYSGLASSVPVPVRAVSLITLPAFVAIFVFESRKKLLFLTTVVYLVTASLILVMGARMAVFGLILVLWYVARVKSTKKPRIVALAVSVLALIAVADLIAKNREYPDSNGQFEFVPLEFLAAEGVSLNVTEVAVQYKEMFRPHVGSYLFHELQSAIVADATSYWRGKSLDSDVSVFLNPELFSEGHGLGSSYIAEAYLIGSVGGVVLISMMIGFGLRLAYRLSRNASSLFLIALVLPGILTMPRSGLLDWVSWLIRSAILIALLGLGWQLYSLLTSIRQKPMSNGTAVPTTVVR